MKILKPTLVKILFCLIVFGVAYYYINSTLIINYLCEIAGEECLRETAKLRQYLVLRDVLMIGLPIAIIGYILIGFVQFKRKNI